MAKKVRDLMTGDPTYVSPSQSVVEAARLLREQDVGSLPVCEDDRVIGMVTDRDIVVRGVADGRDARQLSVNDVASRDVHTVEADENLDEALELMAASQVRRVPVVENGRLVGILAQADIAEHEGAKKTGELVSEISHS
jgi:CBS domain-containing protein